MRIAAGAARGRVASAPANTIAAAGLRPDDDIASLTHLEVRARGVSSMLDSVPEAVAAIPAIATVTVPAAGGADATLVPALLELRARQRGWRCTAEFELDADADPIAAMARRPTSLGPILQQSHALRNAGVAVRWLVPILPELVYRFEAIFSLAHDERIDAVLISAASAGRVASLDADATRFAHDFLTYRLLDENRSELPSGRVPFYESLRGVLVGGTAPIDGADRPIAVLEPTDDGRWRLRRGLRAAVAIPEAVPQPGVGPAESASPPAGEVAGVIAEGARAVLAWATTQVLRIGRGRRSRADRSLPRVLVIGAYGGEHIGDAAILGGVLLRINRRFGTRHAILVSQRPEHTRHLVPMLEAPVAVTVEEYRQSTVGELLQRVDGVVFAGGPLMDLPKQLVKHLYTVAIARRRDQPFILEGIGAGPFLRRPSAWVARRLVRMAAHISVRTAADGRAPLVRGLNPLIGRDPAFDYLDSRGADLTRLPLVDREWLDWLLHDTDGRLVVGLNLRPIRPDYTVGAAPADRVAYTRFVEARFEERLAAALRLFHTASARPPCFVFFPMNAIQFGMSDLRSAYRLSRQLRGGVDFRVWEGDASVDGVVALLRRTDVAITMRFHATIYALAQRCGVIGIDYRVGRRDKVAAVLADAGHGADCARVDEMTTHWLVERLAAKSAAGPLTGRGRCDTAGTTPRPVPPPAPR